MKKSIFLSILLILTSCQISINKQNKESDIDIARKGSKSFYRLIKEKKFKEAVNYFDSNIDGGIDVLMNVNDYLGDLDSVEYVSGKSNSTLDITSQNYHSEVMLNYRAFYKKGMANEEMIINVSNDSLKVSGYHPRVSIPRSRKN